MNKKEIDITPPMSIYDTFRNYNYTVKTAIPEFIDNSIASFRKNWNIIEENEKKNKKIDKSILIIFDRNKKRLIIRDSAFGISEKDFVRALRIKSAPKDKTGLNEFGMGLKTSAFWFGENLEIITKSPFEKGRYHKGAKLSLTKEDIDAGKTSVAVEPYEAKTSSWKLNHGTVITITGINRDLSNGTAKSCALTMASKYRRDIQNKGIKIFIYAVEKDGKLLDINALTKGVNKEDAYHDKTKLLSGTPLSYDEPKILLDKNGEEYRGDYSFSITHKGIKYHVKGEVFVREKGSRKEAGIDIYRRGRIIIDKFTEFLPDLSSFEFQRINGSMDLDEFPVTQAKDNIEWEGELFEKVFDNFHKQENIIKLIEVAKKHRKRAANTDKDLERSTKIFKNISFEVGDSTEMLSVEQTRKTAEQTNIPYKNSDVAHKIITDQDEKIIYSRLVSGIETKTWIDLEQKKEVIIVKLDMNHIFFSPFNDLRENGKFGDIFIKTMREFSVYWAYAEYISVDLNETADLFRERLSDLIEQNKEK